MVTITSNDKKVIDALNNLLQASGNLAPALTDIGDQLTESTKRRFISTSKPEGGKWANNRPVTIARKGRNQPLTGETGLLADTINHQLLDSNTLEVGSPMVYAAMQQFGGTKAEFPHLWGDIPARPFLGVSDQDRTELIAIITDHLEESTR